LSKSVSFSPLNPHQATNGFSGFWSAMILGMASFAGFDIVSTAAEEASAPAKHVPRAILIAVIGMGAFWAANSWVFTLALPPDQVLEYQKEGLPAVMKVAQTYWGWGSLMIFLTAFTAISAVFVSAVQGASRILFALSRHGLLPSVFAHLVGTRRVPRNAILGVLGCALFLDFSTLYLVGNGVESFYWWASCVVFFSTVTFMGVNLANGFYFYRYARTEFSVFRNALLPLTGFVLNGYLLYASFFSALWSLDVRRGKSIVVVCVAVLLVEVVVVLCRRLLSPQVFAHGEPLSAE